MPLLIRTEARDWPSDLRIVKKSFFFGGWGWVILVILEAIDGPPPNFSMTVEEEEEPGTEQMTEAEAISQQHLPRQR